MRIWIAHFGHYTTRCPNLLELLLTIAPNLGSTRVTLTSHFEKGI